MNLFKSGVEAAFTDNRAYRRFPKQVRAHMTTASSPERVWREIEQIGGRHGWYYLNFLWHLRGRLDACLGGVGMRAHRRTAGPLEKGAIVDFYRVIEVVPQRQLTMLVELKMPGQGVLEFTLEPHSEGLTHVDIAAYFNPHGIFGLAYWNALLPVHRWVFDGLCHRLMQRAKK